MEDFISEGQKNNVTFSCELFYYIKANVTLLFAHICCLSVPLKHLQKINGILSWLESLTYWQAVYYSLYI